MRSRCCLLILFVALFIGAGFGAYYGYEKSVVSSSSDDGDDGDDDCRNKRKCSTEGDDTSVSVDGSVDVTGSDDGKRGTDKADHGADFLPAGGANTGECF